MKGFWKWAAAAYARPGVEAQLLALQDDQGQSIPYLLWAAWMAAQGCTAEPATLTAGAAAAAVEEDDVVGPLRQARRALKGSGSPYDQAKAAELAAERTLMTRLAALAPERGAAPADLGEALAAAGALWRRPAEPSDLRALAAQLL